MLEFRRFMSNDMFLNRKVWSEMAVGVQQKDFAPFVSPALRNLLIHVRGGEPHQAAAMRWIFTKGLHQAAAGRKAMAERATQELRQKGFQNAIIPEDLFFTEKAYPKLAEVIGMPLPQFQQFMKQKHAEYEQEFEPKKIPLSHGYYPLDDFNAEMESAGNKGFKFGGPGGLIEYMEDNPHSKISAARDPHGVGYPVKNGVDLSEPKAGLDAKTGKFTYAYRNWTPPFKDFKYTDIVRDLTNDAGSRIPGHLADPNAVDDEDPDLAAMSRRLQSQNKLAGFGAGQAKKVKLSNLFGLKKDGRATHEFPPEVYHALLAAAQKGYEDEPFGNEIVALHFPAAEAERGLVKDAVRFKGVTKELHGKVDKGFQKLGTTVDELVKNKLVPDSKRFTHKFNDKGFFFKPAELSDKKIELGDFVNNGWTATRDIGGELNPIKDIVGKLTKGDEEYNIAKNAAGDWVIKDQPREPEPVDPEKLRADGWSLEPHGDRFIRASKNGQHHVLKKTPNGWVNTYSDWHGGDGESTLLGVSHIKRDPETEDILSQRGTAHASAMARQSYPMANDKLSSQIAGHMVTNPDHWGEESLTPDEKRKIIGVGQDPNAYPASVWRALMRALNKASQDGNVSYSQIKNNLSGDVAGAAFFLLKDLANHPKFRFGDLARMSVIKAGQSGIDNPDNLDEEDLQEVKAIKRLLAKNGIEDEAQQDHWINVVSKMQRESRDPMPGELPPNVLQAFLTNGARWRSIKLANLLRGEAGKEAKQMVRQSSSTGENGEELEHDPTRDAEGLKSGRRRMGGSMSGIGATGTGDTAAAKSAPRRDIFNVQKIDDAPTMELPFEPKLKSPFKTHSLSRANHGLGVLYDKRYAFAENKLKAGGDPISTVLSTISTATGSSMQPEQAQATFDAIGDYLAHTIDPAVHNAGNEEELSKLAKIVANFFHPHGEHNLVAMAKQYGADIEPTVMPTLKRIADMPKPLYARLEGMVHSYISNKGYTAPVEKPQVTAPNPQQVQQPAQQAAAAAPVAAQYLRIGNSTYRTPEEFKKALADAVARKDPQQHILRSVAKRSNIPAFVAAANEPTQAFSKVEHNLLSFKEWSNWNYVVSKRG
jgi:hypothetical protein